MVLLGANSDHIGTLDFMVATPITESSPGTTGAATDGVNFKYNHVFTILEFKIIGSGNLTKVRLSGPGTLAFDAGTIDITNTAPSPGTAYTISSLSGVSSSVVVTTPSTALDAINPTSVYMAINPSVQTENYEIGVEIDGVWKHTSKAPPTGGFKRGNKYTVAVTGGANLVIGSSEIIQHINTYEDFTFRLNNLDNKSVYFVFTNKNESSSNSLPQLTGNVMSANAPQKSSAYSQEPFIISGMPHITKFNNNPWKYPMIGLTKSQYGGYLDSKPEKYIVGNSESLNDEYGNSQLSTVRKTVSAHGKTLNIWVADNCWEGSESDKILKVTQQMVDVLASKFLAVGDDNDVYEWVTNICGAPWGAHGYSNLIASTDDIHIWLTDINNDNTNTGTVTVGYFYARDNFLKSYNASSNEKIMFTIDAILFASPTGETWDVSNFWPMTVISTLSHEFTHMVYFYQKTILKGQGGDNTAVNEMCAQCVEDLVSNKILANGPRGVSYVTANAGNANNNQGRLPLYNSNNESNFLDWSENDAQVLINYSKTYALGAYLMRNYGGADLIKQLVQNNYIGVASIENAVNANGGAGLNYGNILQRFGAANLLSDKTTMAAGYLFNAGSWLASISNGITYNLGSINLYNYTPTPYVYTSLPGIQQPGSNILYRAGENLSGTKEWSFVGMNANTKLTVVIK